MKQLPFIVVLKSRPAICILHLLSVHRILLVKGQILHSLYGYYATIPSCAIKHTGHVLVLWIPW